MSARRRVVTAGLTAAAVSLAGLAAAAPATADTSSPMPWQTFADVVADAHGHVYVTGGQGTDGVWVRNADGSANTTIADQAGASGMALSADGATLYVALYDGAAVSAIDTTSLTETRRYAVPSACPEHVTVVGGGLWFDTTCDHQWGTLATADLVTGVVQHDSAMRSPGFLLPVPGDPAGLLVADVGTIPGGIRRYTISGGTLTQVAVSGWCGPFGGMAVEPDGVHLVAACGSQGQHERMTISDLATVGGYPSDASPDAVATSPALDGVVAAGVNGVAGPDVYVYRGGTLVRSVDFTPNDELLPDGLAWAPDGSRLYAVTLTHSLHVVATPTTAPTTLTLSGPTSVLFGTAVNVAGAVSTVVGPVAGASLTVSRTDSTGTTPLPDATTASDGTYIVSDTVGSTDAIYTVSYAGDATHTAAQATTKVLVVKHPSSLTVITPTTGTRGVATTVSGVLRAEGLPLAGASITLRRTDLAGTKTLSLTTSATGGYSYRDVPAVGGPVTWRASWAGDATRSPVSASRTITIARALTALSITSSASIYAYGAKATVTVHLGTTYNHRDVYVYARPLGTSVTAPGTLIAHVKVNSAGNAVVSYPVKRRTTFTARFAGDYRFAPAARGVSPFVRARVTVTLAGYYGKSGSTFLFHGTDPTETISVAPNRAAGSCFDTLVQAYLGNTWQFIASLSCGALDSTSRGHEQFGVNRPRGVPVRIRASVPNDAASQTLASTSAWVYLAFT